MILITGAAGKTGRAVIEALAARGVPTRALLHRAEQGEPLTELGVSENLIGDLQDPDALRRAADGVHAIYHICPNMHPEEVAIGRAAIAAAMAARVERFVYHSVLHPQTQEMPHHWHKLLVEEVIFQSGLAFTILQPAAYMQNLLVHRQTLSEKGIYPVPYTVETRLSMVDLLDVAQVATTVLTTAGHGGAIYELVGPDFLTQKEVARILGDALGRPVTATTVERGTWANAAKERGLDGYALETLLAMFTYYERHGFQGNANVLTWLLGRPPTTFADFARRSLTGDS